MVCLFSFTLLKGRKSPGSVHKLHFHKKIETFGENSHMYVILEKGAVDYVGSLKIPLYLMICNLFFRFFFNWCQQEIEVTALVGLKNMLLKQSCISPFMIYGGNPISFPSFKFLFRNK
jgi:hypothetical protein